MSDEKPDCCECRLERFFPRGWTDEPALAHGGNLGNEPLGGRPLRHFWHGDWCKHRPTKALVAIGYNTGGPYSQAAPNGTVRVFVEGASDFSKYVWAELEYQAALPFPDRDARYHTADGVPKSGGAYGREVFFMSGPMFGLPGETFVYQPRDAQDDEGYLKSPWPVWLPTHLSFGEFIGGYNGGPFAPDIYWEGTRCRVRWGYRENESDTVLGSVAFVDNHILFNRTSVNFDFEPGTLAIGCNWSDIGSPNADDNVRCGVELLRMGFLGYHGYFRNITEFGAFTIPFELPRSFFVDADVEGEPKPPMPYRLVGLEATAPRVQVWRVQDGLAQTIVQEESINLEAGSFESVVTCGARRAAVFIPPSLQTETGTLPAGPVGPATPPEGGIIRATAPLFVRRDDLNERSYNHVANADSWHATHLVRAGSPLAGRNVLHNLNIEFEQCTFPHGMHGAGSGTSSANLTFNPDGTQRITPRYVTPSPIRTGFAWTISGSGGWSIFGGAFKVTPEQSPRMLLEFPSDHEDYLLDDYNQRSMPPAWAWDAMAGQHTLTPFGPVAGGDSEPPRLVPNAYHAFYDEPFQDVAHAITTPASDDIDRYWDIGPMTDAQFDTYEMEEYPNRTADYRVEIGFKSYPQIWATTRLNEEWQRVGPQDISLEDSGMTTENHDAYSGGAHRVDYVPENAGVTITVRARVGLRIEITKVQGFRRKREKVESTLGLLSYKIPLGRCIRHPIFFPFCNVTNKTSCASSGTAFGVGPVWTKGVNCSGQALEGDAAFTLVEQVVTEAAALAEFEAAELDREAYDYSWTQGIDQNGNEISTLRRPTGEVQVHGDHDCNDVACTESIYQFDISLTGEEAAAISAGQTVAKQIEVGLVQEYNEETDEDESLPVYRTVRISVTQAEGE